MDSLNRIHDWLHRSRRKLATAGIAALAGLLAVHVVFGPNGILVYHGKRTEFRNLTQEVEALRRIGLGKGATYENTIVVEPSGRIINNHLRYPDEFVRHKVLDLLGDLYLLGRPLQGHVVAIR